MRIDVRFPLVSDLAQYGPTGRLLGYSSVIQNISQALVAIGVTLDADAPMCLHITPPFLYAPAPGKFNAVISMWETSGLPPDCRAVCQADLLIVPSSFCRTVFKRAGFAGPVAIAPLGIWPEEWPEPRVDRPGDQQRRVLWVGAPDPRKGIEVLQRAWQAAFWRDHPSDPALSIVDPRALLTIKTTVEAGYAPVGNHALPGMTMLSERLPWHAMRDLYREHDVFVFPSFGEGFGLPVLEAMAAGLLVIAPAHSGLKDFVNRRNAWVIECTQTRAHYGVSVKVPLPKLSHLTSLLRSAVEGDYALTARLRARARADALTMSWEATARRIVGALTAMGGHGGRPHAYARAVS